MRNRSRHKESVSWPHGRKEPKGASSLINQQQRGNRHIRNATPHCAAQPLPAATHLEALAQQLAHNAGAQAAGRARHKHCSGWGGGGAGWCRHVAGRRTATITPRCQSSPR